MLMRVNQITYMDIYVISSTLYITPASSSTVNPTGSASRRQVSLRSLQTHAFDNWESIEIYVLYLCVLLGFPGGDLGI